MKEENNTEQLGSNKIKATHLSILKQLDGFSLWQAKHILKCVEEDLEDKSVIKSNFENSYYGEQNAT